MGSEIKLSYHKPVITDDPSRSYLVAEGSVFIYIVTVEKGQVRNRMFLKEAKLNDRIPSLCVRDQGEVTFSFGIIAVNEAVLQVEANGNKENLQDDFYKSLDIVGEITGDFSEKMVEIYNRYCVNSELDVYKKFSSIHNKQIQIDDLLKKTISIGKRGSYGYAVETSGDVLYDTVSLLCSRKKINLKPYQDIREASLGKLTVDEIAKISHFVVRSITLEEQWYKQDVDEFLGFLPDDTPVAVVRDRGRYVLINVKDHTETVVNQNTLIRGEAVEMYPSFDEGSLSIRDVLRLGMKQISVRDIVWYLVLMMAVTVLGLLTPYLEQLLFDEYIPYGSCTVVIEICAFMLTFSVGNILFVIVRNLLKYRCVKTIESTVQFALMDRIFNLPYKFYRDHNSADLAQRTNYITEISGIFTDNVIDGIAGGVFSFVYLIFMMRYSVKISCYAVIIAAAVALLLILMGLKQKKFQEEKTESDLDSAALMANAIKNIQQVRNSHIENSVIYEYLKKYSCSKHSKYQRDLLENGTDGISKIYSGLAMAVFFCSMVSDDTNWSQGAFAAFISAFGLFSSGIMTAITSFLVINNLKPFIDKLKPAFETLPEFSQDDILSQKLTGEIELSNVSFAYEEGKNIIDHISLKIHPGEYVGVVGSSGCGKSTLLKLLLGFETPDTGAIFYDDINMSRLDTRSLRRKMGVVLQDGGIISGSIFDNISVGGGSVSRKRVQEVIDQVQLTEDISMMPMGLETMLTPDTNTLSGGQLQRIMIARALVRGPAVLFFDEATSALDNVTQKKISDILKCMDITKVVIAHRLSTVRDCDRIIVLDSGRIIEEGSYDELMTKKGFFYNLAKRQIC